MYRLRIHLFFSWPWLCLSIYPPSSPETFQWKNLPLLYQNHASLSHLYTGSLEVRMGICSQQYWCTDENLNLSFAPPPLKKLLKTILWIPIKFIWWENLLTFMELVFSRRVRDEPTSWSFHCNWDGQVFWWLNSQLHMWIGRVITYLNSKLSALVWVYQWFYILFPNHKPFPKSSITIITESSVKEVTPVHIGTFICSAYYGRDGDKVHSSKVNDNGRKLAPKQWVSAWLSISVANDLQISLSLFLCTLLMIWWPLVLMLNKSLFTYLPGSMYGSQYLVISFLRW